MNRPRLSSKLSRILVIGLSLLALGLALSLPSTFTSGESDHFKEGVLEEARYAFGWNGLPAAVAEFTLSREIEDGRSLVRFEGSARSTEVVDVIWRMRDSVIALIDEETLVPRRFQLFRRENKKRIDVTVDHDLEENKFRIQRNKGGKVRTGTLPSQGVYDPVSAMLMIRRANLSPGRSHTIQVIEGKRIYEIDVTVLQREKIDVDGIEVRALKLSADYRAIDGSSSSDDDGMRYMHIWVSDDAKHEILRVEVHTLVGVILGERVS